MAGEPRPGQMGLLCSRPKNAPIILNDHHLTTIMSLMNHFSRALASVGKLILRIFVLLMAMIFIFFIFFFVFFWMLLRVLTGRKPQIDVSAHMSKVRMFTGMGSSVFGTSAAPKSNADTRPSRKAVGPQATQPEIQDVEPRELPKDRN
jgi:hypothetical protein